MMVEYIKVILKMINLMVLENYLLMIMDVLKVFGLMGKEMVMEWKVMEIMISLNLEFILKGK